MNNADSREVWGGVELRVTQYIVGTGVADDSRMPFSIYDLDQGARYGQSHGTTHRTYPNTSDTYSGYEEQMTVVSGGLAQAYLPATHMLNLRSGEGSQVNGVTFYSTHEDSDTYNSGFATLFDARRAVFTWRGCACGTELYNGSVRVGFRPEYTPLVFTGGTYDGLGSSPAVGTMGGSVTLQDGNTYGGASEDAVYGPDTPRHASDGSVVRYANPGKVSTFMGMTPNAGWTLRKVARTVAKNGADVTADVTERLAAASYSTTVESPLTTIVAQYDPITATVRVRKVDAATGSPLAGASFTLSGTCEVAGYAGNVVTMTATSGDDGHATFSSVPYGTYTVTETASPSGYALETASQTVVVREDGTTYELSFADTLLLVDDTPTIPATPATPAAPATPSTPATPESPTTPVVPTTPSTPAPPSTPATPTVPRRTTPASATSARDLPQTSDVLGGGLPITLLAIAGNVLVASGLRTRRRRGIG